MILSSVVFVVAGFSGKLVQIPKVAGLPAPHPYAISGDGKTVIGQFAPGNPFIWRGSDISRFRPVSDQNVLDHYAQAASFDGSIIVGKGGGAYRWKRSSGAERLGKKIDAFAYGVSADGSVVVGQVQTAKGLDGFVWSPKSGFEIVPDYPLLSVSPDGSSACGIRRVKDGVEAIDWRQGLAQTLPVPPGTTDSSAYGISENGLVIVGSVTNKSATSACIWENEQCRTLSNLGSKDTTARAVTYDGTYIGGYADEEAIVWQQNGSAMKLSGMLTKAGVSVRGWKFESVTGIARVKNTLFLTGWAHYNGKEAGFWVTLNVS